MKCSTPPDTIALELARRIVGGLGGPAKAARFFEIKPPSITDWLKKGVPQARLRHLRDVRPDLLQLPIEAEAASDSGQQRSA